MDSNMDDWLNAYTNNVFIPVPSPLPLPEPSASTSTSSGESPMASTSTATSDEKPAKAATKDKKRRACDACRIRRIRCQRADSRSESCDSCTKMDIRCVESKPKARTSQKGARIAQAKMLYGEASNSNALALVMRNGRSHQEQYMPRTPSATEVLMVASIDAGLLLAELVPAVAKLKVAQFPLLRWIEIANEFKTANGRLSNLDGESQALFLTLAALGARSSHSELVVGKDAPTIAQLSVDASLRSGLTLCEYGRRRERVASELLQIAYRKVNENQLLASPTLRNAATLATVEMLILVYQDSLAFTSSAARKARPLSAAVASHLRIIAEDCNAQPAAPFGYYSVAWTSVIRDALVASVTGRALDFSKSDLLFILKVDEDGPASPPSPEELCDGCLVHPLEGPALMRLWGMVLRKIRSFVNEITQPLAVARPHLKLDFFEDFYTTLSQAREIFRKALLLMEAAGRDPPDQKRVLQYCSDFILAQAHRIILWRCSEEQLARAKTASVSVTGIQRDDFENYKARLQALRVQSAEEAFQAARRIMKDIHETFKPDDTGTAEFFVPGYFIYDGLLIWTSFIADTKTIEEGGRIDYTLADKLVDLRTLREAMAITGWSSGTAQPRLEQLDSLILGLEQQQRIVTIPSPAFFSDYINLSPPVQNPDTSWLEQQIAFPTSVMDSSSANPWTASSSTTSMGQNLGRVEEVSQEAAVSAQREQALAGVPTQPNVITNLDFNFATVEQLPTSQDIQQFLNSVNYQLYH